MATQLNMPQMGYDMEEGTVIRWLVEEGAEVALGDAVAEIETDKAAVDFESPVAGVLLKVLVAEGTTVPVGETIAIVGDAGEDPAAAGSASGDEADSPDAPDDGAADAPAPEPQPEPQQERTAMFEDNLRASPVARKLADGPQPAIRYTKRSLNQWLRMAEHTAFDYSLALEMLNFMGPDVREGLDSVRQKRDPDFPSAR